MMGSLPWIVDVDEDGEQVPPGTIVPGGQVYLGGGVGLLGFRVTVAVTMAGPPPTKFSLVKFL